MYYFCAYILRYCHYVCVCVSGLCVYLCLPVFPAGYSWSRRLSGRGFRGRRDVGRLGFRFSAFEEVTAKHIGPPARPPPSGGLDPNCRLEPNESRGQKKASRRGNQRLELECLENQKRTPTLLLLLCFTESFACTIRRSIDKIPLDVSSAINATSV